jgi:glycosyltransferase involved in cell wall biosynthesis
MRVLMLSWEYPPHNIGGLGKHVAELVPHLSSLGAEVHLLTPRLRGGYEVEEITASSVIHRVEPPTGVDAADFFAVVQRTNVSLEVAGRRLFEQFGHFDIIHGHDWLVAYASIALKHAYKTPLVATIHATEYGRSGGRLAGELQRAIHSVEWWLTYEAWRVITCSRFMRDEVIQALQVPPDKIDVIPNGVDRSRFERWFGVDLTEFRARFAHPSERIVFGVGRLVWEKGYQDLVAAGPAVLAKAPDVKFVVAGSGPMLDSLRARAESLGIGPKFYFTGFIPDEDRDRLFVLADAAVFPSHYEPFGIVALEAMAARAPVVATDVGGFREIITNHETGILVQPGNPESLAWGILHTLTHPEWTRQRVENAYRLVTERYNWGRIAGETLQVYRRVVAERKATAW